MDGLNAALTRCLFEWRSLDAAKTTLRNLGRQVPRMPGRGAVTADLGRNASIRKDVDNGALCTSAVVPTYNRFVPPRPGAPRIVSTNFGISSAALGGVRRIRFGLAQVWSRFYHSTNCGLVSVWAKFGQIWGACGQREAVTIRCGALLTKLLFCSAAECLPQGQQRRLPTFPGRPPTRPEPVCT